MFINIGEIIGEYLGACTGFKLGFLLRQPRTLSLY